MALQGNLSDLPLIDLVQVLAIQNRTGILSVNRDFSQAQVCFSRSKIYSAFVHHTRPHGFQASVQGEEAMYDLLSWPDGQFCFELSAALPEVQNVHRNWDYIVLEQCRRQDELEQLQQLEKWAALCPGLSPFPPAQAEIQLDLDEWRLMLQINGQTSLRNIAMQLRQELGSVVQLSQTLAKKGLIELTPSYVPQPASSGQLNSAASNYAYANSATSSSYNSGTANWQTPAPAQLERWGSSALSTARPVTGELSFAGANKPVTNSTRPKVQRGLLSGIIAKIRGL